ncbi:carboxymuconolactone decarboxylase family protein [Catelliglobosispora koreensis]|uniref:carboxymuconolactone decarboxylase family protein n=1 Tax=Catelliglobosispora koreensis TaxID=129052 RepID=UPI0003719C6E|nr:carboxymuconolactone decarboxylase family protein [Catelliglobosispora koreensis]
MSTERLPNPAFLVPEAMQGLADVNAAVSRTGLDSVMLALSDLRASQINGSGACVFRGAEAARRHGASTEQINSVAAWSEVLCFSDEMRAALALTEAVTRLADSPDPVPDEVWDRAATYFDQKELAALLLNIAVTNAFNRLNVATRQRKAMP